MNTETSEQSTHPRGRRALLVVAVVAAIAFGGGAATMHAISPHGSDPVQTQAASTGATSVDTQALWDQLATMPPSERDTVVAGLTPDVRARLHAIGEEIAVAAEHH
jgi:hypothetical protein